MSHPSWWEAMLMLSGFWALGALSWHVASQSHAREQRDEDYAEGLDDGWAQGIARRDDEVAEKLAAGRVLRAHPADGRPVWVRDRSEECSQPAIPTTTTSTRPAGATSDRSASGAGSAPNAMGAIATRNDEPDWREQTRTELTALDDETPRLLVPDEIGRSGPAGEPGRLPPLDRTPWLRDHMGKNAAEWEGFEGDGLAVWAARMEEGDFEAAHAIWAARTARAEQAVRS